MDARSVRASGDELRVVVAAPDASVRQSLREHVEEAGFALCALAADAREAVEATLREEPDVSLLAGDLPGSAVVATAVIAQRLSRTKVVILAASADEDDCLTYLLAGASGYLGADAWRGGLAAALRDVVSGVAIVPPRAQRQLLVELRGQLG